MEVRKNLALGRMLARGAYYAAWVLRDGVSLSPGAILEAQAAHQPTTTALCFEGRRYDYAGLNAAANRVAHALARLGLGAGDSVALVMDNRPEYLFTVLGANKLGAVTALVNTHVVGAALSHALRIAKPSLVIVGSEHVASLKGVELPVPRERVLVWREAEGEHDGLAPFDVLVGQASEANPAGTRARRTDDAMLTMYTSGTTGLPKGAVITNQRFLRAAMLFGHAIVELTPRDVMYVCLPLYHATGAIVGFGSALVSGAATVLRRKFSGSAFWDDCVRHDVTCFPYIGEVCRYLLQAPKSANERRHHVRAIVGAGMRPDVWDAFVARFGVGRVFEFYGSTEGNVAMVNFLGKRGMMGQLMPGQCVVKVDPESEQLVRDGRGRLVRAKVGERGMLLGRIDRLNRFDGYLDRDKTREKIVENAFGDGRHYFNTGDLVQLHAGRYVSFADRLGDTFRWKGENVSTTEVANELHLCPGVRESNVYGVEVPGREGRAGMVSLVVEDGFCLDAFARHVSDKLPRYARPCFVRISDTIEVTGSFKQVKTHLKREGYDPDKVSEPLYVFDGERYLPLTRELHARIEGGAFSL